MGKYRLTNLSFDEAKHIHSLIDLDEPESRIVAANEQAENRRNKACDHRSILITLLEHQE